MRPRWRWMVVGFCVLVTLLAAVTPVGRVGRRTELSYNEGWNVAGAMRLSVGAAGNAQLPVTTGVSPLTGGCCQTELYPAAWGWTTVNYPVLSFALMAGLERMTGEWLVTGRVLSLLALVACAMLLAGVARALGATRVAAGMVGLLCVATFCVCAVDYVGVDDPQLLGDALFLLALWVYVRGRGEGLGTHVLDARRGAHSLWAGAGEGGVVPGFGTVAVAAGLFVVAGCVKQSPVDFALAVLVELLLLSRRKAVWFLVCGVGFGGVAGALNRWAGGPWFVQELLLGRLYSVGKARDVVISVLGPTLVPVVLAGWAAWRYRRNARRRVGGVVAAGVGGGGRVFWRRQRGCGECAVYSAVCRGVAGGIAGVG